MKFSKVVGAPGVLVCGDPSRIGSYQRTAFSALKTSKFDTTTSPRLMATSCPGGQLTYLRSVKFVDGYAHSRTSQPQKVVFLRKLLSELLID
jgi:hypothetical protein